MSFLTSQPDLSNTIFRDSDLQFARDYLPKVIERVDDTWLKKRKGCIGKQWDSESDYAACFLIDIAQVIYSYECGITQRSSVLFPSKVKGLLKPPSDKQFLENFTELQVASSFAQRIRPLEIDPMVPEQDLLSSGQRLKTPEFSLPLSDGTVYFEVTVHHVDALEKWNEAVRHIMTCLRRLMRKRQRNLNVSLVLPFPFLSDVNHLTRQLEKMVEASLSGSYPIGSDGMIQWGPMPIVAKQDGDSALSLFSKMSSLYLSHLAGKPIMRMHNGAVWRQCQRQKRERQTIFSSNHFGTR